MSLWNRIESNPCGKLLWCYYQTLHFLSTIQCENVHANWRKYLYPESSITPTPFPQKPLVEVSFCNYENTTEASHFAPSQARYRPNCIYPYLPLANGRREISHLSKGTLLLLSTNSSNTRKFCFSLNTLSFFHFPFKVSRDDYVKHAGFDSLKK